jgi:hypothetical protein
MEGIREQLLYNKNSLHVCMKTLTRQEQYEFVRLLMATRFEGVQICNCECNQYVLCVLDRLGLERTQCLRVE